MSDQVVQLSSKCHHGDLLESMHQLRLQGHLCDVTVQVDFHGELEEFEVHQVVLAASSGYFKGILLNQDALNKLFLTNMRTTDFATFLEYVYTGKLKVAKDKIGDIHEVAILLDCKELTEICSLALNAGGSSVHGKETSQDMEAGLDSVKNAPTNRVRKLKAFISPTRSKRWEGIPKRVKVKATAEEETGVKSEVLSRRLSNRLAGRKVFVDIPKKKYMRKMKDQSKEESLENTSHQDIPDDTRGDETLPELLSAYTEMDVTLNSSDAEDQDDIPDDDPEDADDPLFQLTEGEEDGEDGRASNITSKRGHTQYKCEKCQRTFLYEKSYLKHISMSHGVQEEITYKCDTCQQTFANRGNLKIHQKHVHSDERLFPCDVCTKTFKRKKDVIRHQRQVHEGGGQRHICTICSKPLSSRTALTLHERIHTGDKPYKCTDCDAKFSQSSALTTHRRTHTGEKPFACDQCDARFTQNHMLSYHKRCHTGEKPFMCESCGKSFASKEYLKHHSRIHTGSKPYKCEQCGRAFAQRNSLHQHLKIHTGERPYCCTNCDKQFTQLNALQRHQRIHTGEKPYMCGLCNRTFTDKSTVRRHTMTHDKDTPWKNYLVVLKDNMEGAKKPKSSPKVKQQKTGAGEQSGGGGQPQVIVPTEHITLHGDWGGPGTIALVSHTSLEGFTVIQTEVPVGTQLQPIVTTDSTGASVITLDGSTVSVPFSIPVSMAHSIPVSSSSLSGPVTLSVPVTVSGAILTPVLDNSTVSTASVLETAVSQTILAPVSVAGPALETAIMDPDVAAVAESTCVSEEECVTAQASEMETDEEQTPTIPTHGHHSTAEDTAVVEAMEVSTEDGAV